MRCSKIFLFGSLTEGNDSADSDINIAVGGILGRHANKTRFRLAHGNRNRFEPGAGGGHADFRRLPASQFINEVEAPLILKRRREQGITVVPVIVGPCSWKKIEGEALRRRPSGCFKRLRRKTFWLRHSPPGTSSFLLTLKIKRNKIS
ncbi:MAG TPA: nucleotidyltransferase domain-containing protein [Candidatus Kapabacteria bacterium]|nr:nucleotidyltransferase domain-containing protein [Candidatus Kapabacteria bacterium]